MEQLKKNDEYIVEIDDITSEGEGVGHIDGFALFVKDALPGDRIRVKIIKLKKNYGYGRMMELLQPSPFRIEAKCEVARQCGGCKLQHYNYEKQLEWKQKKIYNCLQRIGKLEEIPMEPIIGMENPFYYRNKAQFPVGRDKDGKLQIGFYAGRTHQIIDTPKCYIQSEVNTEIIAIMRDFIEEFDISVYDEQSHGGLLRHILTRTGHHTGEIMVCLILNGKKLPHADVLVERLTAIEGMTSICINVNTKKTNVILGEQVITLWGQAYITDYIGNVRYRISPLSFYQVNPVQTQKLYETALEYADLHGNEIVWDLYCGIGTISLFLAQKAKEVYGVEIVEQAVLDATENAKQNQISNAQFFAGAAEEVLPQKYKESNGSMKADVIVVDPPRKGCDEILLNTIVKMQPERVVYVSCDPATLARDVKYLGENGYEVKRVRGCDMFPWSGHVETVACLQRVDM